jgi:hypothetical protein
MVDNQVGAFFVQTIVLKEINVLFLMDQAALFSEPFAMDDA